MNECNDCPGYCCYKTEDAVLLIAAADINRLARFFGITDGEVRSLYLENKYSLRVKEGQSCIFFTPGDILERCAVYDARPEQCRLFPARGICPYIVGE